MCYFVARNVFHFVITLCYWVIDDAHCQPAGMDVYTSPPIYRSEATCDVFANDHLERLKSRPGWGNIVRGFMCSDLDQFNTSPSGVPQTSQSST